MITADAGKFALNAARHLQVVSTEHAERKNDKQTGEQNEYPGLIEGRLQLQSGSRRGDARQGVHDGHTHHVAQRQQESARRTDVVTFAGDDPGQNRDHRQYTRCECEPQTGDEEHADRNPDARSGDDLREPRLLGYRSLCVASDCNICKSTRYFFVFE